MAEGDRVVALALMTLLLTSLVSVFPPNAAQKMHLPTELEKHGPEFEQSLPPDQAEYKIDLSILARASLHL